ncbi:unnamed protein product [Urochloa humidicola]
MTESATDDRTSPAPTVTEGETPAAVDVGAAVEDGEGVNLGAAAAVEEHGEVESEEDPDEQAEDEDEAEGDTREVEAADGMEAALMAPLAVLKPGEELEGEKEELDEEPEEAEPSEEDSEEVEEAKEECDGLEEKDRNEVSKEEHGKYGNKNKGKVADQLSKDSDSGGSQSDDPQNAGLAGGLEIFVEELPKDCVEEDIAMVFSQCGEVKSVRIIKNSTTEKNNGVAFVCYASIEAAKKALIGFKEGIEVKGEKVRVSACQDNSTLYLGNICKGWTKDQVLTTLKNIGIQEFKISFPTCKRGSRGFAFLKFASHYYARAAFRRLMKADAVFGTDKSAKVSFYQAPIKPSENLVEKLQLHDRLTLVIQAMLAMSLDIHMYTRPLHVIVNLIT